MATAPEKPVMVVGVDESSHSFYALQWTLEHFFLPSDSDHRFKLVVVHAKPAPSSVLGLVGPGASDVIPIVEADLKKTADRVVEKAKKLCSRKSVEVLEGDARNVMCEAVETHHASVLVVGSHGYGTLKRVVLGSVSDYCTHNAQCSVMIVKRPKTKQ
ncbi:hypothetical protein L1049_016941 [Liquidambar formosana]|uniref:UspA domain-containing protein n=1 Tax=Liquidambar formosana TaxID=63359 RepID=A0AAP0S064_LIQFO